jgi:uncharacterized protein YukE
VGLSAEDIPRYRQAAERLRELAGRLRSKAAHAEDLLGPVQALADHSTWQGAYADRVREALTSWSSTLRRNADNLRDRAGFLDSVADGYDLTADALARVQSQVGS